MPFPPTFDNVWDETFPPDTQAANLLGQDIRSFKTDIRERVSLMSGTFANRPTPDVLWGGVGYGVMYFSTDTNQVFQWNGTGWVDISTSVSAVLKYTDTNVYNVAGNMSTITIPPGVLQNGSIVKLHGRGLFQAVVSGNINVRLVVGGQTFTVIFASNSTTPINLSYEGIFSVIGNGTQRGYVKSSTSPAVTDLILAPYNDTVNVVTSPLTITLNTFIGGLGGPMTFDYLQVEVIR